MSIYEAEVRDLLSSKYAISTAGAFDELVDAVGVDSFYTREEGKVSEVFNENGFSYASIYSRKELSYGHAEIFTTLPDLSGDNVDFHMCSLEKGHRMFYGYLGFDRKGPDNNTYMFVGGWGGRTTGTEAIEISDLLPRPRWRTSTCTESS